jgi:hypothetical protein
VPPTLARTPDAFSSWGGAVKTPVCIPTNQAAIDSCVTLIDTGDCVELEC